RPSLPRFPSLPLLRSLPLLLFPSPCSGPHPDLHSFPTRRSSDLHRSSRSCRSRALRRWCPRRSATPGPHSVRSRTRSPHRDRSRSEEHTSELQSRFDLVCRLLLEKKKEMTETSVHVVRNTTYTDL